MATIKLVASDDYRYKTFLAACQCGLLKELEYSDFKSKEDPFHYQCSCGKSCKVVRNLRQSARKKVSLIGRVARSLDPGKVDWFGTVLNISKRGMLIKTDTIKNIGENETLSSTILLDDRHKTKLEVHGQVRRVVPEDNCVFLGIEFRDMTAQQEQILGVYVAA